MTLELCRVARLDTNQEVALPLCVNRQRSEGTTNLPEPDFRPGTVSECAATQAEGAIATSLHR
jgi:hypothetical protein